MEQVALLEIEKVEEKFGFSDFFTSIPDHRIDRKKASLSRRNFIFSAMWCNCKLQ